MHTKNSEPNLIEKIHFSREYLDYGKGKLYDYDKSATINSFLADQVAKNSENIAIRFNKKFLTYQQLENLSNQIAHFLISKGIIKHSNIAIYLEPSIETVALIIATLKLGCCYVPLDINYPEERLNFMLEDSQAKFLISSSTFVSKLTNKNAIFIDINKVKNAVKKYPVSKINIDVGSNDPAYIIYTSGSTGKPKGIIVHHQAVNNHMTWMKKDFNFNATDVILLRTPLSFDPSIWEILLPFYVGAQLVVLPSKYHLTSDAIINLIQSYKITTIQFVPSLLHAVLKNKKINKCPSLKRVFCGGETLRKETKILFFQKLHCQLINLYGPTEATIDISSHVVNNREFDINSNIIGKPIYNTNFYILDSSKEPVPLGDEGELYISSDSLSKGYLNRPQESSKSFITNPFTQNGEKLYATGDIVKWTPYGTLEYIGRNNEQVKINGVRIEPGELTSHILLNTNVENCVIAKRTDMNGNAFLACYLVPKKNTNVADLLTHVKNSLKEFFPSYMVPKTYSMVDSIPTTVNGKIDYLSLPDPFYHKSKTTLEIPEYNTPEENALLQIWKELLNVESISHKDSFFDLGGHSILALELITSIKSKLGLTLHIKDIFLYPTIHELSSHIGILKKKRSKKQTSEKKIHAALNNSIIPLQKIGSKTPLFLIHPIGGTVFWYTHLAHLLGDSRQIYGIQDPAIELKKIIFSSIEDMAVCYYSMIKKIQPSGPYIIGGASFGATVAIEIANLMDKNNEKIAMIPILDGWGVYPHTLKDDNYFRDSMVRQHEDMRIEFTKHNLNEPKDLFDIQWHRLGLLWNYHLQPIKHNLILFKAEELLPAFQVVNHPLNHWDKFSKNPVRSFIVPGNHETMFHSSNVKQLADIFKKCLDEVTPNIN